MRLQRVGILGKSVIQLLRLLVLWVEPERSGYCVPRIGILATHGELSGKVDPGIYPFRSGLDRQAKMLSRSGRIT